MSPTMLLLILSAGCATRGNAPAPTAAADADPSQTVTHVFDVRELIIDIPDFTDAPDLSETQPTSRPAARAGEEKPKTRDALVAEFMQLMMDEVDPASWQARGGAVGAMQEKDGHLVVTQTRQNIHALRQLIADLQDSRRVQLTIEVRFLGGEAAFAEVQRIGGQKRWQFDDGYQVWPAYLNERETQSLLRAISASRDATVVTAPRLTLFNGQRAYVLVSRQTAFVEDVKPSTTQPGEFEPRIGIAQSGVLLDVEARASIDRKNVIVTLRPQLRTLLGLEPRELPDAPAGKTLTVQVPQTRDIRVEATTSIPVGHTALLRLRPKHDSHPTTQPADAHTLMMVRPKIVIAKEDAKPEPLLSARQATLKMATR